MKKYSFLFALGLLVIACQPEKQAQSVAEEATSTPVEVVVEKMTFPEDSVADDGRSYHGLRISGEGAVSLADMQQMAAESGGLENVKIAGTVDAVCKKKGCWMTMKLADGSDMRIRFKDYGFFVPLDADGNNAIVEGTASFDTTSVADLRHYAVDGGMTEEEAAEKYTEPEVSLSFLATGVIMEGESKE